MGYARIVPMVSVAEPIDLQALGRVVKRARERLRYTQAYVADATGYSDSFISHIERGQQRPSSETLRELGRVLQLDYNELAVMAGYLQTTDVGDDVEIRGTGRKAMLLRTVSALPEDSIEAIIALVGALRGRGAEVQLDDALQEQQDRERSGTQKEPDNPITPDGFSQES